MANEVFDIELHDEIFHVEEQPYDTFDSDDAIEVEEVNVLLDVPLLTWLYRAIRDYVGTVPFFNVTPYVKKVHRKQHFCAIFHGPKSK